ncbi:uncharacterized protein LOC135344063 isoform X1 [Halichondria panicea]|uniref:uncharacterized protein LOC135344063 isoform X1 n=1 Tax=Halichondria panicea TaxID=6063 RepID=UPI00312B8C19
MKTFILLSVIAMAAMASAAPSVISSDTDVAIQNFCCDMRLACCHSQKKSDEIMANQDTDIAMDQDFCCDMRLACCHSQKKSDEITANQDTDVAIQDFCCDMRLACCHSQKKSDEITANQDTDVAMDQNFCCNMRLACCHSQKKSDEITANQDRYMHASYSNARVHKKRTVKLLYDRSTQKLWIK